MLPTNPNDTISDRPIDDDNDGDDNDGGDKDVVSGGGGGDEKDDHADDDASEEGVSDDSGRVTMLTRSPSRRGRSRGAERPFTLVARMRSAPCPLSAAGATYKQRVLEEPSEGSTVQGGKSVESTLPPTLPPASPLDEGDEDGEDGEEEEEHEENHGL
mmetsp:Transcript_63509/g.127553  ORF Transcript_63509/g.127553 Transcript_63509/m.127553 type:complete len:158 (-) Transcript_63509:641-1114(-)